MSLNLGDGVQAARKLANSEDWAVLRQALYEQMRKMFNSALESPPELRADQVGYARALRDVYQAFESATSGAPYNQVDKPGPVQSQQGGRR